jgi:hypothetical protein
LPITFRDEAPAAHAKAQAAIARLDLALLPSIKLLSSASAFLYGCYNVMLRLIGDA